MSTTQNLTTGTTVTFASARGDGTYIVTIDLISRDDDGTFIAAHGFDQNGNRRVVTSRHLARAQVAR
jgi:hypothetical protein